MSWTFNPPPGWPPQPEGWQPPPGWVPDPSWPPAPPGWQFWVPAGSGTPPGSGAPPGGQPGPAYQTGPGYQAPHGSGPHPPGYQPAAGQPPPPPVDWRAPAGPPPVAAPTPWTRRWWAYLMLVGVLLLGGALGYAGTALALRLADDDQQAAAGNGDPTAPDSPVGPAVPPTGPPAVGDLDPVCGDVAVIILELSLAGADEAAEMLDANPDDRDVLTESFDRVAAAYAEFDRDHC